MDVKLIEIRDKGTFIPAIAVRLAGDVGSQDHWLLRRAGYADEQIFPGSISEPYILLTRLDGGRCEYDVYAWGDRTWAQAHLHIIENWNALTSGDVVDVQFIKGESTTPKKSERLTAYGTV